MPSVVTRLPALVALAAMSGCLHYEPATPDAATVGSVVRLQLTGPGAAGLTTQLGSDAREVDGRLVTVSADGYLIAVSGVMRNDARVAWQGEQVLVPRAAVAAVEHRVLDRGRTAVAAVAALAAVAITGKLVKGVGGGSGTETGGPPSP